MCSPYTGSVYCLLLHSFFFFFLNAALLLFLSFSPLSLTHTPFLAFCLTITHTNKTHTDMQWICDPGARRFGCTHIKRCSGARAESLCSAKHGKSKNTSVTGVRDLSHTRAQTALNHSPSSSVIDSISLSLSRSITNLSTLTQINDKTNFMMLLRQTKQSRVLFNRDVLLIVTHDRMIV